MKNHSLVFQPVAEEAKAENVSASAAEASPQSAEEMQKEFEEMMKSIMGGGDFVASSSNTQGPLKNIVCSSCIP